MSIQLCALDITMRRAWAAIVILSFQTTRNGKARAFECVPIENSKTFIDALTLLDENLKAPPWQAIAGLLFKSRVFCGKKAFVAFI